MEIKPIARFRSPFSSKFGIPKQSGLVETLEGQIIFEPEYRDRDALRGLEDFDYIWLIWEFSANKHAANSPVVRPPVLGGNAKIGVFATRSPFRPNAIGLSSVRISSINYDSGEGPVINVLGADLMDGTPIFDIKPYIPYADSHAGARSGFVSGVTLSRLNVNIPEDVTARFSPEMLEALREVLELDPRPRYHNNPDKIYGMPFAGHDVHFKVEGDNLQVLPL